jgi:hypothetical protein
VVVAIEINPHHPRPRAQIGAPSIEPRNGTLVLDLEYEERKERFPKQSEYQLDFLMNRPVPGWLRLFVHGNTNDY